MQQRSNDDDPFSVSITTPRWDDCSATRSGVLGTGPRQLLAARYELLALVGVGGMGTVYRARDLELEEIVALKLLRREISGTPGMVERFRREVRLSRKVTHPNVARVFDIGEHDGDKFLTMEFVEGESLAALLSREGRLSIDRTLEIVEAVCAGLAAAHRAGIVHRDLKPDNVLLDCNGRVVLTDFGIARAVAQELEAGSTAGGIVGTPAYMAPEQVQGLADVDDRADVYALGAMLYEMLTGERAWKGDAAFAVAAARLMAEPPDPQRSRADIPDALGRVVLRCMARLREDRFSRVDLVSEELASLTRPALVASMSAPPVSVSVSVSPPSVSVSPPPLSMRAPPPPLAAPRPDRDEKSVAVLPFVNQGAPTDAYLAAELTDDLIDTLSMTPGLKVRPRGLVARFREGDHDPREIGRELEVQVVVEGSVRRRDGTVRISARMLSVADGFQLWAKRFDRPDADVLRINDEAADAIARALTLSRTAPSRDTLRDPIAVDLLLRGRYEYRKFWPPHLRRAIALYDQALERVPDDPMLLSASAVAHARLWFFTGDGGELAERAAVKAVAVAPHLAEARLAMAAVLLQRLDVVGAMKELKRAMAACVPTPEAQSVLAYILLECGEVDVGVVHMQSALAGDVTVRLALQGLSRTYALLERWDLVDDVLTRLALQDELSSHSFMRCRYALWRREPEALLGLQQALPTLNMPSDFLRDISAMVDEGLQPSPRVVVSRASNPVSGTPRRLAFLRQVQAELAGYFGFVDEAVAAVELAIGQGLFDLLWLERCPLLDQVRAAPGYPAMRAEVKRRVAAVVAAYREG